eukprot:7232280-Pyramimonas_sp.AAC.1
MDDRFLATSSRPYWPPPSRSRRRRNPRAGYWLGDGIAAGVALMGTCPFPRTSLAAPASSHRDFHPCGGAGLSSGHVCSRPRLAG